MYDPSKKFFIEIGSNCFDTLTPLAEKDWHGIFIEPIGHYMDLLKKVGYFPNCTYEQCAIVSDPHIRTVEMIRCDETKITEPNGWMHGIGHIATNIHTGERILFDREKNLSLATVTDTVPAKTLDQLILDHNVHHINFMKIDIEGHEMDVLNNYSWKVLPEVIKVEHSHCDDIKMTALLEDVGYHVYFEANDLYCIRK